MKIKFNYLLLLALLVSFTQERSLVASRMPLIEKLNKELEEVDNNIKRTTLDLNTKRTNENEEQRKINTMMAKGWAAKDPRLVQCLTIKRDDFRNEVNREQSKLTTLEGKRLHILANLDAAHKQQKADAEQEEERSRDVDSLEREIIERRARRKQEEKTRRKEQEEKDKFLIKVEMKTREIQREEKAAIRKAELKEEVQKSNPFAMLSLRTPIKPFQQDDWTKTWWADRNKGFNIIRHQWRPQLDFSSQMNQNSANDIINPYVKSHWEPHKINWAKSLQDN